MRVVVRGGDADRAMKLDPIPASGLDALHAIDALRSGIPVGWTMEPGDMTRYRLMLIPLWTSPDLRLAAGDGGVGGCNRWLVVVKCGEGNAVVLPSCQPHDLEDAMANPWTRRLVSALVRGIWHLIDNPEVDPSTYVFEEGDCYGCA